MRYMPEDLIVITAELPISHDGIILGALQEWSLSKWRVQNMKFVCIA
jgi:hypothetical protein